MKGASNTDYRLWLLCGDDGVITLTGWTETTGNDTSAKIEHWPIYTLCQHRSQLADRLTELGLDLAAGADINDLDHNWDVYVRHPDIAALRTQLNREQTHAAD
ncbi:hypothetical protein MSM1_20430 [Mycobacterium sp. SM1]|uniref:hypothetical protein n=1 Tax=Mycobacterium sp. SM1 TaxID=2816243 RepID=UPI001BD1564B|nr:hypothetical protein [Mycobacterium sp. SM1]MBS4730582.1 hypothetical protein [Mycobacterium sp. SM1]